MSRPRPTDWRAPARLATGWVLLAIAWVFANPPFAAPDEADHYVRAIGIAQGKLVGDPAPAPRLGENLLEIRFTRQTQRAVVVPPSLVPAPFGCYIPDPLAPASCLNHAPRPPAAVRLVTSVGTYPPAGLLAAAAVVTVGDDPYEALRLGRLASLAVALALLSAALVTLATGAQSWLVLAGVLAAATPMAIFLTASLTPSGLATSAAIALVASLLRLTRDGRTPRAVWGLFGLSAALLALSHPTGLTFALLIVAGFVALSGFRDTRRLLAADPRGAKIGALLLGAGVVAAVVWHVLYGPTPPVGYRGMRPALMHVPDLYWDALRQVVGAFGYLETRLPLALYLLWFAFVGGLAIVALQAGGRRDRRVILIAGALAVVIPVGGWLLVGRWVGIGIDGREYLPVLVAFPMIAGELAYRHRHRIPRLAIVCLAALAAQSGVLQFVAWYLNGQRSAVGTGGPLLFPLHAQWEPPLGWLPWLVIAASGAAMLAAVPLGRLSPVGRSARPVGQAASRAPVRSS